MNIVNVFYGRQEVKSINANKFNCLLNAEYYFVNKRVQSLPYFNDDSEVGAKPFRICFSEKSLKGIVIDLLRFANYSNSVFCDSLISSEDSVFRNISAFNNIEDINFLLTLFIGALKKKKSLTFVENL